MKPFTLLEDYTGYVCIATDEQNARYFSGDRSATVLVSNLTKLKNPAYFVMLHINDIIERSSDVDIFLNSQKITAVDFIDKKHLSVKFDTNNSVNLHYRDVLKYVNIVEHKTYKLYNFS